eukprot:CAMPEP_0172297428 /NCGR_PEP_ID=MMETSP1058-20130122/453_1 /TAXON_ID=83371 /ORGANISM="Detonula confervacea, Strain CCMP 353" /LENGTH=372 /DNA_ID=CAMNT_0013006581 /DNA_START=524 /DNA_END=1642 /DNA_ORIENTATION=+
MFGFTTASWVLVLISSLLQNHAEAFVNGSRNIKICHPYQASRLLENAQAKGNTIDVGPKTDISVENYQHKSFKLTYLYKRAAPGRENDRPIILIHPIGIGLSSWFWKRVMESYNDNPPIFAPDLIGCGLDHGAGAWCPKENGLFFPLSWVEGVETLMNTIVIPRWKESQSPLSSLSRVFGDNRSNSSSGGCLVIAQGGLAPVGIVLAKRNPFQVEKFMLTSPQTYEDVTTAVPEPELQKNYNFLCSPILGGLAFALLESREVIKFFSNLFLFQDVCDEQWLDETQGELCKDARTPVQAFNAGLLQHRSFEDDLKEMPQSLLVVSGKGDKRVSGRQLYQSELDKCTLTTIGGLNVLPWENPTGVVDLIKELGY